MYAVDISSLFICSLLYCARLRLSSQEEERQKTLLVRAANWADCRTEPGLWCLLLSLTNHVFSSVRTAWPLHVCPSHRDALHSWLLSLPIFLPVSANGPLLSCATSLKVRQCQGKVPAVYFLWTCFHVTCNAVIVKLGKSQSDNITTCFI